MKRGMKKLVAGILMATLLMGSTLAVNAEEVAEGSAPGAGAVEGTVKTDIFEVDVPLTVAEGNASDFDFILDPEGLIAKTSNAAYADSVFEAGNLFFKNGTNEESKTVYSNTSNAQTITNYSTIKVDVTVTATVADLAGVTVTADNTFADDTSASVYLALKSGDTVAAIEETEAELTTTLEAIDEDAYVYGYTEEDGYTYTRKSDDDLATAGIVAPAYEFAMTGACNSNGDWSELADATPSVSVVWKVVPYVEAPAATAPSIATTSYTAVAGEALDVVVDLGTGDLAATGIASITFERDGSPVTVNTSRYTFADNTITFASDWVDQQRDQITTSRDYTITFNDAASTVVVITVTK